MALSSSPPVDMNLDGKFGATALKSEEVKLTTMGSGKRNCPAGGSGCEQVNERRRASVRALRTISELTPRRSIITRH